MMNVYYSWVNGEENFNIDSHCTDQNTFSLLSIEIMQKEGEAAKAYLEIPASDFNSEVHRWAWISVKINNEVIPIFLGQWSGTIHYTSKHTAIITLLALSDQWSHRMNQQLSLLASSSIEFEATGGDQPLESLPYIWHFHPTTLQIELTHLFKGTSDFTTSSCDMIEGSFHQLSTCQPYKAIHVEVIAEWVQELEGTLNILPIIAQMFPGNMINTLTPEALINNWPKAGNWLKRSGYFIHRSDIKIISAPTTGALDLYPRLTKPIVIDGKPNYFERFWLTGVLEVGWQYRQKRRQKVVFTVTHQHQFVGQKDGVTKKLVLKVSQVDQHLTHQGCADFFQTSLGRDVLLKAVRRAQCHLAASARNFRFQWRQPFSRFVTLDQEVHFQHPYTKSWIKGKLVSYRHHLTSQGWLTDLTVAVAAGIAETNLPETIELLACSQLQGLVNPEFLAPIDFIDYIKVHFGPEEQLQQIEETGSFDVPATQIECSLKDLRSNACLEQTFRIKEALTWSAPDQLHSLDQ